MHKGLRDIKKEDLVRFILAKEGISEDELISLMSKQKDDSFIGAETIPISAFNAGLFPLEAATRYMKENLGKKISIIARVLGKNTSSISLAYRKASKKSFSFSEKGPFIPVSEFEKNSHLSILEVIVDYLRRKGLRFSDIARLSGRDVRTVWTVHQRARKKSAKPGNRMRR
ncbi:hypothetical protein COV19_05325 [Candidatus Woesearchaeota archaeon CG10_big_fil_rev_8_21_14_0_10_44_13]|nr:MAG: hypothetical protein COV19_05325 [Candidatus Woesearchaeota archaeon CG10_big_fil_rev_8_21_14_0_10_44_13]